MSFLKQYAILTVKIHPIGRQRLYLEQTAKHSGCLPIYADDAVYEIASRYRMRNQEMIRDRLDKLKELSS